MHGFLPSRRAALLLATALVTLSCAGTPEPEQRSPRNHRAIGPGVAFELLRDNRDLIVLDVRPFAEYVSPTGHLARALSVPAKELETLWPALRLSAEETVLIYGAAGDVHQEAAMRYFIARGQRYVFQIEGGLEAWRAGGFEVVVEDAPLSPVRID